MQDRANESSSQNESSGSVVSFGNYDSVDQHVSTRVVSFTSGKGGVGKTNMVVNTAIALSRQGRRVLVVDADLGLANVDILLNLKPQLTIQDVLKGTHTLADIMQDGPDGIVVIPAISGVEALCNLSTGQKLSLFSALEAEARHYDYLLIDTRAGIDSDVMYFNSASSEIVLVVTPEPTSLTDAYAMVKLLTKHYGEREFLVVVNDAAREEEARTAFAQLSAAIERFLQVRVNYMGYVPSDESVNEAIIQRTALLEKFPSSPAAVAVSRFARQLMCFQSSRPIKGNMQLLFRELMESQVHG